MSALTVLEEHKCVTCEVKRGKLLSCSAKWKKAHQSRILDLIGHIRTLEASHKQSKAQYTLDDLTRNLPLVELSKRYRRRLALSQKLFYEEGDKCSRLLLRRLRAKRTVSTVHLVADRGGKAQHVSNAIASIQGVQNY